MSLMSRVTLWTFCGISAGTIGYVHYKQLADREKLHEGVLKDMQRQQRQKIKNLYLVQQQAELTKILKNQQSQDDLIALQLLEDSKKKT